MRFLISGCCCFRRTLSHHRQDFAVRYSDLHTALYACLRRVFEARRIFSQLDFENYLFLTEDPLYIEAYLSSLRIAFISTFLLLLIGYPMALAMARAPSSVRPTLVMLVILPFWTSFLIRVYAWIGILKPEGLLTVLFQWLGFLGPDQQVNIFRTETAIFIGIVYSYLPFMVLPLYSALEKLDNTLLEAAADLGCPPWKAFWKITFPLSLPGVVAGAMICFIPITGNSSFPICWAAPRR